VAAVILAILAVGAGLLLGRSQPDRAARIVVSEFVVVEDGVEGELGPDPVTPTSGPQRGTPRCGVHEGPLPPPVQVEALAGGVVLLQHGPDASASDRDVLERLAAGARVAVAPNPDLDVPVVATAWRHRMGLDRAAPELLEAFITGHVDRAPDPTPCPGSGG
jgi:hypothetical protein